jgi:hypothetical protein
MMRLMAQTQARPPGLLLPWSPEIAAVDPAISGGSRPPLGSCYSDTLTAVQSQVSYGTSMMP